MTLLMTLTMGLSGGDYFATECDRYLIAPDTRTLEDVPRDDLVLFTQTQKARIFLYDHPLDRVMLRLVEHELETREMITP